MDIQNKKEQMDGGNRDHRFIFSSNHLLVVHGYAVPQLHDPKFTDKGHGVEVFWIASSVQRRKLVVQKQERPASAARLLQHRRRRLRHRGPLRSAARRELELDSRMGLHERQ